MSTRYKPYPACKPSAIKWLEEAPEHWKAGVIKRGYDVCLGKMLRTSPTTKADTQEPYLRAANLEWGGVRTDNIKKMWFSPDEKLKLRLRTGDLLISEGGDVGRCSVWAGELPECYIQNAVNRVRGNGDNSTRFLYYWVYTIKQHGLIDVICNKSTIAHYTAEKVAETECLLPPEDEQRAIASFLDRETGKIDRMIGKQERMIELLKEKRQAVISHAVTKGLNPNAPMKDSGIKWLGEIPEHWDVRAVSRSTTKITNGYVGPTRGILLKSGVPYVQATHIKRGVVNFDEAYFVSKEWSYVHSKSILKKGDVLIVQTGAGTGDVGLVSANEEGYNCHALIILAPKKTVITGGYLSAVLRSDYGYSKLYSIRTGGMHPHLNCGEVQFVKVPVPPMEEQQFIVEYLNESSSKIDHLIAKAEQAIGLMKERRTALISAAVTGKIDVRDVTSNA